MFVEQGVLQFVQILLDRFDRMLLFERMPLLLRLPDGDRGIQRNGGQDRHQRKRRDQSRSHRAQPLDDRWFPVRTLFRPRLPVPSLIAHRVAPAINAFGISTPIRVT
ncbi:hypothetical protein [Paraburkholderia lycopersici]|uniref:Uncharacterized protein n=1 Tax=Paraburkholderia lycopersici TaxID=416944 RepID=A0A1G6YQP5_9BURK|nr:hypothetical protein [Paraburkholderia lycopersici]SDD92814.1 hypothetical protein SAMN05421548_12869 [Paraburkholderia lycopersici]